MKSMLNPEEPLTSPAQVKTDKISKNVIMMASESTGTKTWRR